MMKICILGDASSIHTKRWVDYFVSRGAETHLLSFEPSIQTDGIEHILHSNLIPRWIKYPLSSFKFHSEIEKINPDIVNAHFVPNYGLISAIVAFKPLVISCWGSDVLKLKSCFHTARVRFALKKTDLVTVDGEVLLNAVGRFGISRNKILNVPMGIDPGVFNLSLRKPFSSPFRIVNLRKLEKIYNLELFIQAIPKVRKELNNEVKFIMLHNGSQVLKLRKLVARLEIEEELEFLPELTPFQVAEILNSATIYVSTSTSDSTSVTLLEAMACGAFPIVTDISGNREWIKDGENGYLVPLNEPEYLADKIVSALRNPDLIRSACAKNAEIVRIRGIFKKNMQLVEDAFIKLIK